MHIAEWLAELGLYENGMNGPSPLTHKEIHAWADVTKSGPTPDEVKLIRSLSAEFCSFYYACDNDTLEPMQGELTPEELAEKQKRMRAARKMRASR